MVTKFQPEGFNYWIAFDTVLCVIGCTIAVVVFAPFILALKLAGAGKGFSHVG